MKIAAKKKKIIKSVLVFIIAIFVVSIIIIAIVKGDAVLAIDALEPLVRSILLKVLR